MGDAISAERPRLEYGDVVVIGGGCYGSYYLRQLTRAANANAVAWQRLVIVDRDADCLVAKQLRHDQRPLAHGPVQLVVREWGEFLDDWIPHEGGSFEDTLVPSPLMPHLLVEYLERSLGRVQAGRITRRHAPTSPVGTPWERAGTDGSAYVSHATWTCPVNCIEPAICPHTRDVRNWTMPASLAAWVGERRALGDPLLGPFTFHCTHRAYGVGMVDKRPIQLAEAAIAEAAGRGPVRAVVATASHCHGAVSILDVV